MTGRPYIATTLYRLCVIVGSGRTARRDWTYCAQWQLRTLDYGLIHSGRTRVFLSHHRPSVVLLGIRRGLSYCTEPAGGQMSAEDYAADQLITSRGIQSSAVTDATTASLACITHDPPSASASSSTAAYWFNTPLYSANALTPLQAVLWDSMQCCLNVNVNLREMQRLRVK